MGDKRLYLYGAGRKLDRFKSYIPWDCVICVLDNSLEKENTYYEGKKIYRPDNISFDSNDIIIITTQEYYWEIREELITNYNIRSCQIVGLYSWLRFTEIAVDFSDNISEYKSLEEIFYVLSFLGANKVISYTDCFATYGVISINDKRIKRWKKDDRQFLDCVCGSDWNLPYRNKYVGCNGEIYDAFICIDVWGRLNKNERENIIRKYLMRYLLVSLHYCPYEELVQFIKELEPYGKIYVLSGYMSGWIIILDFMHEQKEVYKMYMVTHKKIHNRFDERARKMSIIYAGINGRENYGYLRDDIGDNISALNPWINECTALYWIWKHSCYDYIGLCHYRRLFLYNDDVTGGVNNILWPSEAMNYLRYYDIIVARIHGNYEENGVLNTLAYKVESKAITNGLKIVRNLLEERQPEYVTTFNNVLHGVAIFPCNMFVTSRTIFNDYCEWLFSFIIDAAKAFDISDYDEYSKRVIGFIAERMLTVWLLKHNLKIKELPVLLLPNL